MNNRRNARRLLTDKDLTVYDRETCEPRGLIINMSRDGFLLWSDCPTEPQTAYRCFIVLPEVLHGVVHLEFEAVCQWCSFDEATQKHHAGYQFQNVSADNRAIIENMLASWFVNPAEPVAK